MKAPSLQRPRKRYSWTRINNNFPDLPAFRAAASIAKARVHQVVAVALRLDCVANVASPRGSVADMSVPEFAAALQLPADTVARIRAALEDPDIAYVMDDFIVDFYERNPDDCDLTAAERQRRHREKLRDVRRELSTPTATGPPDIHRHALSRRDTVTVTPPNVTLNTSLQSEVPPARASGTAAGSADARASGTAVHTNNGDSGDYRSFAIEPELWLATEGERLVIERMEVTAARAKQMLFTWLQKVGESHATLAEIVAAAGARAKGVHFHNLIFDGCDRAARSTAPQLPLPPMVVDRKVG